jgi:hypothetical protein
MSSGNTDIKIYEFVSDKEILEQGSRKMSSVESLIHTLDMMDFMVQIESKNNPSLQYHDDIPWIILKPQNNLI